MSALNEWHRRQAMQLAVLLPESRDDAVKIVKCLEGLIDYMYDRPSPEPPAGPPDNGQVLRFPGG